MTTSPPASGKAAEEMTNHNPIRSYGPLYPPMSRKNSIPTSVRPVRGAEDGPVATADDEDPEMWGRALAAVIIDCMEGRRDLRSVQRWLSRELFPKLSKACLKSKGSTRRPGRIKPHTSRSWKVNDSTYEIAITLWDRDRLRAVAMRMERVRSRWTVTAVELG